MIGGIGEMLGFEAESGAVIVSTASLAVDGAIQEIPAVELQAGFGGPNFHQAAGGGLENPSGPAQIAVFSRA